MFCIVDRIARIELGDEAGVVAAENHFFVDFMRDPPEATGEEDEDFDDSAPKVYEKITDWNALITRVQQMQDLYNEHVKGRNWEKALTSCRISLMVWVLFFFNFFFFRFVRVSQSLRVSV